MAWNEPGGGNDKDPWGNKNNKNDGPPDLDEVIRKMQQKFGGLFGGGGGGGKKSSDKGNSTGFIILIALFLLVAWTAMQSFYTVDQAERGVVLRFGKFSHVAQPGLNFLIPVVDRVTVINVSTVESIPHKATMLTQDENIIQVALNVQYIIADAQDYFFNVRSPEITIQSATSSAIREIVGKSKMDYLITDGREEVAIRSKALIQEILNIYKAGISIKEVTMQDINPPEQVKAAFDDAIKAREDEQRFINEAQTYARGVVPEARGSAARMLQEAEAYQEGIIAKAEGDAQRFMKLLVEYEKAPEVTRERLYLESMESVLQNSSKVVMDVKGGNNMMYLPLDQLMNKQRAASAAAARSSGETFDPGHVSSETSYSKTPDLRSRGAR